jgi:hypothetical protein
MTPEVIKMEIEECRGILRGIHSLRADKLLSLESYAQWRAAHITPWEGYVECFTDMLTRRSA